MIKNNQNKKDLMKKIIMSLVLFQTFFTGFAQERMVKIDFESGSFLNHPNIPYDEPFGIVGDASQDIELVKVNIKHTGKDKILHSFVWNRIDSNASENFNIVVPPVLTSNTEYDFEIITYKSLSKAQKTALMENVANKVRFFLLSNLYYDGKNVNVNKPKKVYEQLQQLIQENFQHQESKNLIPIQAPSSLVYQELEQQNDFKFGRLFKKANRIEKNDLTNDLIKEKTERLVSLIVSELTPYVNSQLVQHYRKVNVTSVETDNVPFTLPVNFGLYAWNKTININNTDTKNIEFTPAVGITIPFSNKSKLSDKSRMIDSFGVSAGLLLRPVEDANGTEYVTPGVDLPIYAGLGIRLMKVVRLNAGVLILGEKGTNNFNKLTLLPTVGLALELNLWMGIKK